MKISRHALLHSPRLVATACLAPIAISCISGGDKLDANNDKVVDSLGAALDTDGDGVADYFDIDGDGVFDGVGVDTDGDGEADAIGIDTDGDGILDALKDFDDVGTGGMGNPGTGGDGSMGTGATTGTGGTGTGASGAGCEGATIYCDTFEGGSIDAAQWATTGIDFPVWDGAKGHSGTGSVRFEDAGNIGRFLKHTSGFPAGGQLYFRAYMNFAQNTVDMAGHTGFIVGADSDSNGKELRFGQSKVGCQAGTQVLDLNHIPSDDTLCSNGFVSGGNPADATNPEGTTLLADTWYCVETFWDMSVGEFRIWIDGAEIAELHAKTDNWCMATSDPSTCPAPDPWPMDLQMVKFGTQVYNGGAGTIWYDDVALSTTPIGCN